MELVIDTFDTEKKQINTCIRTLEWNDITNENMKMSKYETNEIDCFYYKQQNNSPFENDLQKMIPKIGIKRHSGQFKIIVDAF